MSDKQWVVVPRELDQWMRTQICEGMETGTAEDVWRRALAAAPRYEAGDVVEAAVVAFDACYGEGTKHEAMKHAITAALPELVSRCEALEGEVASLKGANDMLGKSCGELLAEVDRPPGM